MFRRLAPAFAALVLLQTPALAGTEYIGIITMRLCDDGLDLCGNTLNSSLISLPLGPFTEDFVFDIVNGLPYVPDNVPLVKANASLGTSNPADFYSASILLYNHLGAPLGFSTPFVPIGTSYVGQAEGLIFRGTGYYAEVTGVSNVNGLPLQVSVSAFDLGPVVLPEPPTWAMLGCGFVGLALAASLRARAAPRAA